MEDGARRSKHLRRELLFVSPRFLFPVDSGGKIRTTQILKSLKGGDFHVRLVSPSSAGEAERYADEINTVSDASQFWPEDRQSLSHRLRRTASVASEIPVAVASDRSAAGRRLVSECLDRKPAVVVFDFPHSAVLAPRKFEVPSVLFTHNVESWIFERHARIARNPFARLLWTDQYRKMVRFEERVLRRFDTVIAVSDKDAAWFRANVGIDNVRTIPTGVDLDFFRWQQPGDLSQVIFVGSMDWLANQDGIQFFMRDVWPRVIEAVPDAKMKVVGRSPPSSLVREAPRSSWSFTGFVDDVRPHVMGSAVAVIPLRVGGGTRIKAYEAMAMGIPVVSTSIGVEGLPVEPGRHFLCADDSGTFAAAVIRLLREPDLRAQLSRRARDFVESNFSNREVARIFESICSDAARKREVI